MAKPKHYRKGGNHEDFLPKVLILITATANLIAALIELIKKLLG